MKKIFLLAALVCISCTQVRQQALDEDGIGRLRENAGETACEVLKSKDMLKACLDESVISSTDTNCTYRVNTRGITDQMESGRCWLFSTLNVLRAEMIMDYDMEDFEFSQTYGQFWDVLEKSNRFLENVIEYRREPVDSRMNEWLFKKPIGDGGHFANAAHIISKYGVVPQEIMPEVHSSTDNLRLMNVVRTLLRRYGLMLRDADRKDIQAVKEKGLSDIYRVLALNLGEPPTSFTWALKDKDGNIVDEKEYTPASFRDRFVRHDLENDYVILMDDPTRPYYKMYAVDNSRNCFELANWTFLNVPATELGAIGVESLKGGRMFYFSCDTAQDALMTEGIYDTDLYDLEGLLGVSFDMTKEELVRSCEIKSYHAMAMAGVEVDKVDKPVKWVVENSFGTVRGWDGFVVIDGEWFDRYMFRMAVERRFVPENLLPLLDQKPKLLKSWNPTY